MRSGPAVYRGAWSLSKRRERPATSPPSGLAAEPPVERGGGLTDYPRAVGTVTADTPLSGVAAIGGAGTGTTFRDGWRGDRV